METTLEKLVTVLVFQEVDDSVSRTLVIFKYLFIEVIILLFHVLI